MIRIIRELLERYRFMREHRWTHAHFSQYLDDELESRDRDRVEEHAGRCPQCRRVLATLRRTLEGLRGLRVSPDSGVATEVIERFREER